MNMATAITTNNRIELRSRTFRHLSVLATNLALPAALLALTISLLLNDSALGPWSLLATAIAAWVYVPQAQSITLRHLIGVETITANGITTITSRGHQFLPANTIHNVVTITDNDTSGLEVHCTNGDRHRLTLSGAPANNPHTTAQLTALADKSRTLLGIN